MQEQHSYACSKAEDAELAELKQVGLWVHEPKKPCDRAAQVTGQREDLLSRGKTTCLRSSGGNNDSANEVLSHTSSLAALVAARLRTWCAAVLGATASHRPSDASRTRAPVCGSVTCDVVTCR